VRKSGGGPKYAEEKHPGIEEEIRKSPDHPFKGWFEKTPPVRGLNP